MMKSPKKIHSVRNIVDDTSIKEFYDLINEHYHDGQILSDIIKSEKSSEIIKSILSKSQKSEKEVFIVNTFLRQLPNFISILNTKGDQKKTDAILNKISSDLSMQIYPKNYFLMRVGEIGKTFYVTLSGKVSIIVPKPLTVNMNKTQYMNHLKMLYNNNEKHLLERTYILNKSIYNFELQEVEIKDESLIIENPLKISIKEYISRINGENIKNENDGNPVKIIGYFNVVDLSQGSSFGEIALINENNQRTATIIVKEDSIFGVLSAEQYKYTMKKIQEKIKRENIEFVYNIKIFKQIGLTLFTNNYWNYFISEKKNRNEIIFSCEEERKKLYFIQDGEIKLVTPNLTREKRNLIIGKLSHIVIKEDIEDEKGEDIVLTHSSSGDILGLEDILYNHKFICNAICISNSVSYFSIDINILNEIKEAYNHVDEELKKFEKKKNQFIIK